MGAEGEMVVEGGRVGEGGGCEDEGAGEGFLEGEKGGDQGFVGGVSIGVGRGRGVGVILWEVAGLGAVLPVESGEIGQDDGTDGAWGGKMRVRLREDI